MTHNEFKLWIGGFLQLSTEDSFTQKQFNIIQNHAALVKAVDGYLDEKLTRFLSELEKHFADNPVVSLSALRIIHDSKLPVPCHEE